MVFASMPDGLLVLSSELTILSANRSFLKPLGLTAKDVHGRHLLEVVAADGLHERILEVLSTGVAQQDVLFSMGPAESNVHKSVRITLTRIRLAEDDDEARLLLIIEDLTEEERLLRKRLTQTQSIARLSEAVSRAEQIEQIYAEALDALRQTIGCDRAAILLLDPDGLIRLKASYGISDAYVERITGHSLWTASEKNAQPILIPDVEEWADPKTLDSKL